MSVIIGTCGILASFYFVFTSPRSGFGGYLDIASLEMLLALPPSIMLLSHTVGDLLTGIRVLIHSVFNGTERRQLHVIKAITVSAAKVRRVGVGSLVDDLAKFRYPLLRDGVSLIVNNFSRDEIRYNLQSKINARQQELYMAHNLFENMAKVCPGIGMIGTVIGLIAMMSNLKDPATIGSGMALALLTTLYGLLLGTIIYAPLSERIAIEAEKIAKLDNLVFDGVLALKEKKSTLHFKDILKTYGATQKIAPHVEKHNGEPR